MDTLTASAPVPAASVASQDALAEETVLGACLLAVAALEAAQTVLEPEDFFRPSHGVLFATMRRMNALGLPVDAVTLVAELGKDGSLTDVGGKVRVHEIARLVPASSNVLHYAEIVREQAILRDLNAAAVQIQGMVAERDGQTATEVLGAAESMLEQLRTRRERAQDEIVTLHQAAEYLSDKFRNPPDNSAWIPSPWTFPGPLGPGRLYVLAGYTADGKSSVALQFMVKAAKAGFSSTFLTLEMSKWDLTERLASVLGIPANQVQTGVLTDESRDVARAALGGMTSIAQHARIWDAPSVDVPTIRAHVKAVRPSLLVVDHLHQFHLRAEYERQDLEATVRGLWNIAREFNITVLLVAQLSRSADKRHPFPMPTLSALKGSAAIEQLAWAVWFIYRERDDSNLPGTDSQFLCAKNRSGTTGTRRLAFDPRRVRFTEIAREA